LTSPRFEPPAWKQAQLSACSRPHIRLLACAIHLHRKSKSLSDVLPTWPCWANTWWEWLG